MKIILNFMIVRRKKMAQFFKEPSRTFNEYLLVPGYTTKDMTVEKVSLKTPIAVKV